MACMKRVALLSLRKFFPQPFFTESHRWAMAEILLAQFGCSGIKKTRKRSFGPSAVPSTEFTLSVAERAQGYG